MQPWRGRRRRTRVNSRIRRNRVSALVGRLLALSLFSGLLGTLALQLLLVLLDRFSLVFVAHEFVPDGWVNIGGGAWSPSTRGHTHLQTTEGDRAYRHPSYQEGAAQREEGERAKGPAAVTEKVALQRHAPRPLEPVAAELGPEQVALQRPIPRQARPF